MQRNSNLAFVPKRQPEQRPEAPQVQIRQYVRPKAVTRRRQLKKNMAIMIYIVILCAALIYGKVKLTEENQVLETTRTEFRELNSDYTRLEAEVGKMASLKNIEQKAKEAGMSEVKPNQIVNIVVSNDNEVEVVNKKESLFSSIEDWFIQLKEYIIG